MEWKPISKTKAKLTQVVNQASKIIGDKQVQFQDLFSQSATKKAIQVYNDPTHSLPTH